MAFSKYMAYYQEACKENPEFLTYEQKFQETTTMVREFHSRRAGTDSSCVLPFDVLMLAASHVTEIIKKSAEEILKYKQDVGGNIQLLRMVRSYFELCRTTVDSLRKLRASLGACVTKLRAIVRRDGPMTEAIRCVEEEANRSFLSLTHLIGKHVDTLTVLQEASGKDSPVGAAMPFRQVISIVLRTVFASAVIISILAAVFSFPPALVTVCGVVTMMNCGFFTTMMNCGFFTKWLDALWDKVRGKKKPSTSTQGLEEMKLPTDNSSTLSLPDGFSKMRADDRERALLWNNMDELDKQIEKCCSDIHKAKVDVLNNITGPSRRTDRA